MGSRSWKTRQLHVLLNQIKKTLFFLDQLVQITDLYCMIKTLPQKHTMNFVICKFVI